LFALAFQAQFDKVLPKRVVVHDSSLQREELLHGSGVLLGSPQNRNDTRWQTRPTVAGLSGNTSSGPSRLLPNAVIDVIDVTVRDKIGRFLLPFNPKK
jgi:hypothetical protein